ncbi:hypothetical protein [Hyphomicrobium sp.]|uniref:hypothetical protein n=1 Tax=Hyphomicrobium sp. TaxID=82 RepID=UPI0025B87F53|nr:hypothetical protein [Hyphomicrobium sp.]MCC7253350.1 hypothetical protein [Hyphomicrobium sp.]
MLSWLSRLFRRRREALPSLQRRPMSSVRVVHDDKVISVDSGTGLVSTLAWADLGSVTVLTTDAGPFQIDLYWVLTDRDGRHSITIPMDASGEHTLLKAMQARLSGFDNMAVVEAMSSTSGGVFQVWPAAEMV